MSMKGKKMRRLWADYVIVNRVSKHIQAGYFVLSVVIDMYNVYPHMSVLRISNALCKNITIRSWRVFISEASSMGIVTLKSDEQLKYLCGL